MGERVIFSYVGVFEEKVRTNQSARALKTIRELQSPAGKSPEFSEVLEEFVTLDTKRYHRYLSPEENALFNLLDHDLKKKFGAHKDEVVDAWNEAEARKTGKESLSPQSKP